MADRRKFEFVLPGYTPETLPMARLAQYLLDLAEVLGEHEHVHFDRVAEGSALAVQYVDEVAIPKVRDHVAEARIFSSESPHRKAFEALDAKLRSDGQVAELLEVGEAQQRDKLLYFPGVNREVNTDPVYGPIPQHRTLQGRIINVGGSGRLANVNIQLPDEEKTTFYCEATRETAMELAPLIYKYDVRVEGVGKFWRHEDGRWEMRSFRIGTYEKLNQRPLSEVIDKLRDVTRRVGLDRDVLRRLADLRNDPSEA